MNIEKIKSKKEELNLTTSDLSVLSGVPIGTINKILNGETSSPRYSTIKALEKALHINESISDVGQIIQKALSGPNHTLEEFYSLPKEIKVELINGSFYALETPSAEHQLLVGSIYAKFHEINEKKKTNCSLITAPITVQLPEDLNTVVQPDITVMNTDMEETEANSIIGVPELIVEVLSAESRIRDGKLKLNKYQEAGVSEYWIVDAENKKVYVYKLQEDILPSLYGFEEKIPVSIWDENIVLNFPYIQKKCITPNKTLKAKKNSKTKIPENPELEREKNEQALADGRKTTLLDKGILPLSSFGSGGLKF